MNDSVLKKWKGKKVSVYGYHYNPFFRYGRKQNQVVYHFVGSIEEANRYSVDNRFFPMWVKEYEEEDYDKSLLGETGILATPLYQSN